MFVIPTYYKFNMAAIIAVNSFVTIYFEWEIVPVLVRRREEWNLKTKEAEL